MSADKQRLWIKQIIARPSVISRGYGLGASERERRVRFIVTKAVELSEVMRAAGNHSDSTLRSLVKAEYHKEYGNPILFSFLFTVIWWAIKEFVLDELF